jgi:hypothetical protein
MVSFLARNRQWMITVIVWYNQWGELRAEWATPVIEVSFGKDNPQPGTQRTFILVVEDSQGNTAQDEVSITLGETGAEETPPPEGGGETNLVANAGPDQTVPGPSPVAVQFDGSGSTGDIVSYQWYNQYGLLLAEEVTPVIEVNFGYEDPQPGTQRTFTLVVEDSQGNTAQDQVTITLGEEEQTPPPEAQPTITLDPAEGPPGTQVTVTGSRWIPGYEGDLVELYFTVTPEDTWYRLGETTVGNDGTFTATVTIPADAAVEEYILAVIPEVRTATAFFQVTGSTEQPFPPLNPAVVELRFYESGYEDLPLEQRVYEERFASETSRYINWELDLEYVAPGSPVDFKITAIYLRDTGTGSWAEFHRHTVDAHVEGEWTGSLHWSGYGFDAPGNWAIGFYRVDIYFEGLGTDGQLMASQGFEVSGEAETSLIANAGPDQTVPGPSPVAVQLDGSGSTGDIVSYQWYNQWGELRAEWATPVIEVSFGKDNPQPGTQRTFTLVVADSQGNTAQDQVTIT